jgi:hypothetical protein
MVPVVTVRGRFHPPSLVIREAALARLAYTAGRRGEEEYDFALVGAGAPAAREADLGQVELARLRMESTARVASEQSLDALAVSAQSEQVRKRARVVRAQSARLRQERLERKWQPDS